MKRTISLLLALLVLCALAVPALAAAAPAASVRYTGHNLFSFDPGSSWTDTDLFPDLKGVMPGDVITQQVEVKNLAACCDYINLYMRAQVHHTQANPLSPEVAKEETIATMEDFLSQLTLTVWNGNELIYRASPDQLDGLRNNVLLGSFRRYQGTTLTLQLEVPLDLGNEYASRVGEVDWVFTVEEFDWEGPKTGDHTLIWPYATALLLAVLALFALLFTKRRKQTH